MANHGVVYGSDCIKDLEKKIFDLRWSSGGHRRSRLGFWLVVLATTFCITGCMTLKKAGVTSLGAGGGAIVGSVLSSGVAAPILGATTSAFVTDVVTEAIPIGTKGKETMSSCAPDNFWTLLGSLVEIGGFFLLGIILIPMLLGWFLPGPVKLKGRDKKPTNPYLR